MYSCSAAVISRLVILPEIRGLYPAGTEGPSPIIRHFLTFFPKAPRKAGESDSDISSSIIFFYLELFTLSTEFSTGEKA